MTVTADRIREDFTADGIARVYQYATPFYDAEDLVVWHRPVDGSALPTAYTYGVDYEVTGGDGEGGTVVFGTAPAVGLTVTIERVAPLTQEVTFASGRAISASTLETALDRLCRQIQQVDLKASRGIKIRADQADLDGAVDYAIPLPEPGRLVVGRSDALGWENRDAATISGAPVALPLSVAEGGTGATTAPAARANLGLGTAAVVNTGTTSGTIPVLDGSGKVARAVLPTVSNTEAGALPAAGATPNSIYLSGTGWTRSVGGIFPLAEVALSAGATSLEVLGGSDWDIYDDFLFEFFGHLNVNNVAIVGSMNIAGTWRESAEYLYAINGTTAGGLWYDGNTTGAKANKFRVYGAAAGYGPGSAAEAPLIRGVIKNLYKFSTAFPPVIMGHSAGGYSTTGSATLNFAARALTNLGLFRGLRLSSENGVALFQPGARLRIWGSDAGSFS